MNIKYLIVNFFLVSIFNNLYALNEIYTLPTFAELITSNGNHGIFLGKYDKGVKATIGIKLSYGYSFLLNKIEGDDVSIIELPVKITDFNFLLKDNENIVSINKRIFGDKIFIDILFKNWLTRGQVKQLLSYPMSYGDMKVVVDCQSGVHRWCGKSLRNITVYNQFKLLDNEHKLYDDIFMATLLNDFKNKIFLGHTSGIDSNADVDNYTIKKILQKQNNRYNCKKGINSQKHIVCQILIRERPHDVSITGLIKEIEKRIYEKQEIMGLNVLPELFDDDDSKISQNTTESKSDNSSKNPSVISRSPNNGIELSLEEIINLSKLLKKEIKKPNHPNVNLDELKGISFNTIYNHLNNSYESALSSLVKDIKIDRGHWNHGNDLPTCPPIERPVQCPQREFTNFRHNYTSDYDEERTPYIYQRGRNINMDLFNRNRMLGNMSLGSYF